MHDVLAEFVGVLRRSGLAVSPAEHMDALEAAAVTGFDDRAVFKAALAAALAKTPSDRRLFDRSFESFFSTASFVDAARSGDGRGTAVPEAVSPLAALLLSSNRAEFAVTVAEAARSVPMEGALSMLQRGLFVQAILRRLNVDRLNQDVDLLRSSGGAAAKSQYLEEAKEALVDMVRSYVEARLRLQVEGRPPSDLVPGDREGIRLTTRERRDVEDMERLLSKMIRRLHARYGRRRKRARIGFLDFKGSVRKSLGTQGLIFDPRWKKARRDRPEIVALCDVSRSVRNVTRFFLFFLYSLNRLVSKIRTFVFCSNLVEVSDIFRRFPLERALARIESGDGLPLLMGLTDYGKTLEDFAARHVKTVPRRTVMVVLGDARNNHDDPAEGALRRIRERVRRIVWLNPEPPALWDTGDSVMNVYRPHCDVLLPCSRLQHLEELVPYLSLHLKEGRP